MHKLASLLSGIGVTAALAVGSLVAAPAANAATPDAYQSATTLLAYAGNSYRWGLQLAPESGSQITVYAGAKKEQVAAKWRLSTFSQLTFGGANSRNFQDRPTVELSWYQAQYFRLNFDLYSNPGTGGTEVSFSSLSTMYDWYDSIIVANDGVAKGFLAGYTREAAAKADVKKNSVRAYKTIIKIGLKKYLAHPTRYAKTVQKSLVKSSLYKGSLKYAFVSKGKATGSKAAYAKYTITAVSAWDGKAWRATVNTRAGNGITTSVKLLYNNGGGE